MLFLCGLNWNVINGRSWRLHVRQSAAGWNVSTEAEDNIGIRGKTSDKTVVTVIFGLYNSCETAVVI